MTKLYSLLALVLVSIVLIGDARGDLVFDDLNGELEKRGVNTSYDGLTAALNDESRDIETRHMSALAIGESRNKRAIDDLIALIAHSDPRIRAAAISGINKTGDPRAIDHLKAVLIEDHPVFVKRVAATGLAEDGSAEAKEALDTAARYNGQHPYFTVSIIEYFDGSPNADTDALFQSLLNHPDLQVRTTAAISLSRRFEGTYVEALVEAASHPDLEHSIWSNVLERLEEISGRKFSSQGNILRSVRDSDQKNQVNKNVDDWWRGTKRN